MWFKVHRNVNDIRKQIIAFIFDSSQSLEVSKIKIKIKIKIRKKCFSYLFFYFLELQETVDS
jgi:hypothetical protein